MNFLELLNTKPNRDLTYGNYFNSQSDILNITSDFHFNNHFLIVSGKRGSGVTHLLSGLCNTYLREEKKAIYVTAQSLAYMISLLKNDEDYNLLFDHLSQQELIVIDNFQFFYKKSQRYMQFLLQIIHYTKLKKIKLVLGCSDHQKDLTKNKRLMHGLKMKRLDLKELSSYDVFMILRNKCSMEDQIPDALLFAISAYNGMIQQHIHCLISIRFNPLFKIISAKDLTSDEFDELFNIKSFFSTQQFRKCFSQTRLDFPQ